MSASAGSPTAVSAPVDAGKCAYRADVALCRGGYAAFSPRICSATSLGSTAGTGRSPNERLAFTAPTTRPSSPPPSTVAGRGASRAKSRAPRAATGREQLSLDAWCRAGRPAATWSREPRRPRPRAGTRHSPAHRGSGGEIGLTSSPTGRLSSSRTLARQGGPTRTRPSAPTGVPPCGSGADSETGPGSWSRSPQELFPRQPSAPA
jgi:hypothetical protein